MKFRFQLEKILQHKQTLEGLAQRDWMEARAKLDAALKELDDMYKLIDTARLQASERTKSGEGRGPQLAHFDEFVTGQKIRIERFRSKIRELMAIVEQKHEILVEASREKKTFEKLRERRLMDFKKRQKMIELKQMDELVVSRFKKTSE